MKKLAIITGAGSGIGRATAILFHKNNWDLLIIGRDPVKLAETKKLCIHGSGQIHVEPCDVGNESQVKTLASKMSLLHPESIALVNNAGIFKNHQVGEGGSELWLNQFQVNLFGAVFMLQQILPLMNIQFPHSIVNVASTLGLRPTAETSAYSASKAAMVNWTQSLALGLGAKNIRVNCVCPGIVDTPIQAFNRQPPDEKSKSLEQLKSLQPLGRVGTPEEIAESIYFLASENSRWTTGAILSVDGGINLA